jgi:chaperonin GroEL
MTEVVEMAADMNLVCSRGGAVQTKAMAKQLHFNKNMEALKKLQAGVDKLSSVVGVTLGPKVHVHLLQS